MIKTISVTGCHIAAGIACESESCPVALAINTQLAPGVFARIVGRDHSMIKYRGPEDETAHVFSLPDSVVSAIVDNDLKIKAMQPMSFPLDLPAEFWKEEA